MLRAAFAPDYLNRETAMLRRPPAALAPGLVALATALLLAACGPGSGDGLDEQGRPLGENDGTGLTPDDNPEATLAWIQDNVFTPVCTGCHIGAAAPEGLRLDEANAPSIVGRASSQQPSLNLIEPDDPGASYLILKVEGDPAIAGARMPFDGPYLDATTIGNMRDWVTRGAPVP